MKNTNNLDKKYYKEDYKENGFTVFHSSEKYTVLCQKAFEEIGPLLQGASDKNQNWKGTEPFFKHFMNPHDVSKAFRNILESPDVSDYISTLFGDQPVFVTHSKLSMKEGENPPKPWLPHQDHGYKDDIVLEDQGCTFGVFLEDCSEKNGTIEVYPKSHKLGKLKHKRISVPGELSPQLAVETLPDINPMPVEGTQGTTLAFAYNTIHQSGRNTQGGRRCIFIFEVQPLKSAAITDNGKWAVTINGKANPISNLFGQANFLARKALFMGNHYLKRVFSSNQPSSQQS